MNISSIEVNHSYYGCECPCCGTEFRFLNFDDGKFYHRWAWSHPENLDELLTLIQKTFQLERLDLQKIEIKVGNLDCPEGETIFPLHDMILSLS